MKKPVAVTLVALALLLCHRPKPAATKPQEKPGGQQHRSLRSPHESGPTPDPHGGIPMGIYNAVCDDAEEQNFQSSFSDPKIISGTLKAKNNLEVDWNPSSTEEYSCDSSSILKPDAGVVREECTELKQPLHVCLPDTITYSEDIPTSGAHRPLWPRYGEYDYVPPQRWLHNLEHGGIVFLYHPCADEKQVDQLREIARGCLYKHIITPNKNLPMETPFAALAWGCKLLMSSVAPSKVISFVKEHALKGHEGHVNTDGQYSKGLKAPATLLFPVGDTEATLCVGFSDEGKAIGESHTVNNNIGMTSDALSETANQIVADSARRHSRLNSESEKLRQNIQKLIGAFRKLQQ